MALKRKEDASESGKRQWSRDWRNGSMDTGSCCPCRPRGPKFEPSLMRRRELIPESFLSFTDSHSLSHSPLRCPHWPRTSGCNKSSGFSLQSGYETQAGATTFSLIFFPTFYLVPTSLDSHSPSIFMLLYNLLNMSATTKIAFAPTQRIRGRFKSQFEYTFLKNQPATTSFAFPPVLLIHLPPLLC